MKNSVLLVFILSSLYVFSQTYTVGTQTITYTDAARSNRSVGVEFRYPGTNSSVAVGQFPFVIFAHGFQMNEVPYYPYADSLAKQGYIVGLLTTETSLSPSHANFAQDLIFVHNKLILESNTNNASPFYQKVTPKGALGGHSMGGGSTVLSAQYGNPAACYFTFAAANTNPSSIAAASSMTKPYLAFAGSRDCVAPMASHQQPMYDASTSPCKFLINITDGLHCQFGNGNFQCNFGEGASFCASSPLSRSAQINKTLLFLVPFLDYYLKGDCNAWTLFESRYASNTDAMFRSCTNVIPTNPSINGDSFFCSGSLTTLTANPASFSYVWSDNSTSNTLNVSTAGNYSVAIGNGTCSLPAVSVSVAENFPPAIPSTISASDTVCSNIANINISVAADPNASNYYWLLPNGWNITSGNNTNAIQATSGLTGGTISVEAQNICGTSGSIVRQITVIPSSLGSPFPISGPDTICDGSLPVLSLTTLPVSGADSLFWSTSNSWPIISGQGSDSILVIPLSSTSTISVSAVNSCGASLSQSITIVVIDTPQVTITQQAGELISATPGGSYQWYLDGVLLPGETNQVLTPNQSGAYLLMITDENGCSGISEPLNFIFSDIDEIGRAFQIFPNPNSSGTLWIVSEMGATADFVITNISGQQVFSAKINTTKSVLDVSSLPLGLYLAIIKSGEKLSIRKLVVE